MQNGANHDKETNKPKVENDKVEKKNAKGVESMQKAIILKETTISVLKVLTSFIISKLEVGNTEQLILSCKVSEI